MPDGKRPKPQHAPKASHEDRKFMSSTPARPIRILAEYIRYYEQARCHLALGRNAPIPRAVESPEKGRVVAVPYVGGLHHRYTHAA